VLILRRGFGLFGLGLIGFLFLLVWLRLLDLIFYFGLVVIDRSGYLGMIVGGFVIDPWENCRD